MKSGSKTLRLVAALLLFLLATLPLGGCLDASVPSGENGGQSAAELQAELRDRIEHVRNNADSLAATIHAMINQEREKQGLEALQWDQALAYIALSHSEDMAKRDYFDHVSPEGNDFADRYERHGYRQNTRIGDTILVGGENLALYNVIRSTTYNQETSEIYEYEFNALDDLASSAVQGWMESPGHRENILTPFTREGIGVFISEEGEVYITENFS